MHALPSSQAPTSGLLTQSPTKLQTSSVQTFPSSHAISLGVFLQSSLPLTQLSAVHATPSSQGTLLAALAAMHSPLAHATGLQTGSAVWPAQSASVVHAGGGALSQSPPSKLYASQ